MARIPWVGTSATAKSSNVSNLRLLNGYSEMVESQQGKTTVAIYGTPGLLRFLTLPAAGPIRGGYTASNGRVFVVQGDNLYEIFVGSDPIWRGPLHTLSGPVSFTDNGIDLVVVDNPDGYALTFADNTYAQIVSAVSPDGGACKVDYLDSRFLFLQPDSQQFRWSELLDTTIDPLSLASAEARPDLLVSMLVVRSEIWLFGSATTEVWVGTGDSDNPFIRLPSGFMQQGCAARHSPARVGEAVCWLSQNEQGAGMVLLASGFQPTPISSHAVSDAIQGYIKSVGTIADAIGWSEQTGGHHFYWLTFPAAGATWVYDATAGLWHERGYLEPSTGLVGRHRANCSWYGFGRHLVGDYADGRIYELSDTTYDDDGSALLFEAVLPPIYDANDGSLVRHDSLCIDAETGVGLSGGLVPGTDPQLMLSLTDDGGHTWEPDMGESLGIQGDTTAYLEWHQLGSSYDRRYRIRISDPVKRAIVGAYTTVQVLG